MVIGSVVLNPSVTLNISSGGLGIPLKLISMVQDPPGSNRDPEQVSATIVKPVPTLDSVTINVFDTVGSLFTIVTVLLYPGPNPSNCTYGKSGSQLKPARTKTGAELFRGIKRKGICAPAEAAFANIKLKIKTKYFILKTCRPRNVDHTSHSHQCVNRMRRRRSGCICRQKSIAYGAGANPRCRC